MKKNKRFWRTVVILFCMTLLITLSLILSISATPYNGSCGAKGDNLMWTLDTETGVLFISGEGEMEEYDYFSPHSPWSSYYKDIESIVIGEGITRIGDFAFAWCYNLTSIDLPEGLVSIGQWAFADCTKLESVILPESLISIDGYVFYECEALESITFLSKTTVISGDGSTIPEETAIYGDADSSAKSFATRYGRLFIELPPKTIELPPKTIAGGSCGAEGENLSWELKDNGVLSIFGSGEMADYSDYTDVPWSSYKDSIHSINISMGITKIGAFSFSYFRGVSNIVIPNGVTRIGKYAFAGSAFTSISFSNSLVSIGSWAFSDCDQLASVTFPSGLKSIGERAFLDCFALESVTLPATISYIGSGAFACGNLQQIKMAEGTSEYHVLNNCLIKTVEKKLVVGCDEWNIPTDGSVTNIGENSFHKTFPSSSDVVLPEGIINIGGNAFSWCTGLSSIILPESLAELQPNVFSECFDLISITFLSRTTIIGDDESTIPIEATICGYIGSTAEVYAEKHNRNFIPLDEAESSVEIIGTGTLGEALVWEMHSDGKLLILGNDSMPDFGPSNRAPWYNKHSEKITSVVLGEGITTIGAYAFQNLKNLKDVALPSTLTEIGVSGFALCSSLTEIEFPKSVNDIKSYAFYKAGLERITFPMVSTRIADSANTFPESATIYCSEGSNAAKYAKKFNRDMSEAIAIVGMGICGDDLVWEMSSNGNLIISGDGQMANYDQTSRAPWYNKHSEKITSVVLGEGVTTIGAYAFQNLRNLKNVVLPSTLTEIGVSGFALCSSLTEIEFPKSVNDIKAYAFYKAGLEKITFPLVSIKIADSANTFSESATIHCSEGSSAAKYAKKFNRGTVDIIATEDIGSCGENLIWEMFSDGKLIISGDGEMKNYSQISRAPWYNKYSKKITSVVLGEGVTTVGAYAFQNLRNLKNVVLPSTLTKIGVSGFALCSALTEVELPVSTNDIKSYAFYNTGLEKITFLSATTKIMASTNTFPESAIICGYEESTAARYAVEQERVFEALRPS